MKEIRVLTCPRCGHKIFPPKAVCSECGVGLNGYYNDGEGVDKIAAVASLGLAEEFAKNKNGQ